MREMMDFIEFIRDTTRFLRDAQYLQDRRAIQLSVELVTLKVQSESDNPKAIDVFC